MSHYRIKLLRIKKPLGESLGVQQIVGDGNCLFRAVTYEVTLSEEHHPFFRSTACNVLRDKRFKASFESTHIPNDLSANAYIKQSKMEKLGTWGTDIEIIALATVLDATSCILSTTFYVGIGRQIIWYMR